VTDNQLLESHLSNEDCDRIAKAIISVLASDNGVAHESDIFRRVMLHCGLNYWNQSYWRPLVSSYLRMMARNNKLKRKSVGPSSDYYEIANPLDKLAAL
jgi:hypothetical protein